MLHSENIGSQSSKFMIQPRTVIDIYKHKLSRTNHVVQLKLKLKENKTPEEYTLTYLANIIPL